MGRAPLAAVVVVVTLGLAAAAGARDPSRPGPFAVGVTTVGFRKPSVTTGAERQLATVVWYPAVPHTGTATEFGLRDATVRHGHFPWIVYSHGTCGRPVEASYLTMALASQGFVVAAPPHPGNTADDFPGCLSTPVFADSAVNRVPDVRYVVDAMLALAANPSSRFAGRLRRHALGMAGISFGGFTTLLAVQMDPRFRAALSLVPGGTAFLTSEDIAIPTIVIGAERDQVVGFAESEKAYQRLAGPRILVELLGANHLSVVDDCAGPCIPGDISQEEAHALVLRYALPFARRYLAGRAVAVPGLPASGVVLSAETRRRPSATSVARERNR